MNNIDYGSFYGVRPGEKDFSGALKRSLEKINKENEVAHLDRFVEILFNK